MISHSLPENFSYCVAIRTLGTAGEKYLRELQSLARQTIPPKRIFVYIAEGYPLPPETIGVEQYVRVKKGMVAQRALSFDEIDTDYVLFLDDDVELEPDSVERLAHGLAEHGGDAIAADTFHPHLASALGRLRAAASTLALPHRDAAWAFKIRPDASFSYNTAPTRDVCFSESAAGPASLWRLSAFRAIRYPDELWLDEKLRGYGEDLYFFNKLAANGFRLLVHYRCGITHLDARTGSTDFRKGRGRLRSRAFGYFMMWWRVRFDLETNTRGEKLKSLLAYGFKFLLGGGIHLALCAASLSLGPLCDYLRGNADGWRFVHSEKYRRIPNFIVRRRETARPR